jgi:hypothetical protein
MDNNTKRERKLSEPPLPPPPIEAAIELQDNHSQNSLTPSQKKWEYGVYAVELDATERR